MVTNAANAPNFQRSAVEPVISAGVMIANVAWKATKAIVGIVWADPSVGTTSWAFQRKAKWLSPRYWPVPLKAQVKPMMTQVTLTIAIAAKFCISIASTCLARTMPP